MKNIIKSAMLLLCGIVFMTACSDDNDSNPTLQSPSTFKLNKPAYAASNIDLGTSSALSFAWSQPDYGFPVAAQYQMEFSLTNTWTVSTDEAAADESGETVANYAIIDDIFTACNGSISAEKLAKALQQIALWPEAEVPATQKVYARASSTLNANTIYSNVVEITVAPYYVELKDAQPQIWYLIGGCIGDGKWTNGADAVGTSMIPMFTKAGVEYDKKTGEGIIEYTGFFPDNAEFKIIETLGSWDYGICGNGSDMGTHYRNGDDDTGNITIANAGYYTITVDTKEKSCEIVKADITPSVYSAIYLSGDLNAWDVAGTAMSPVETISSENHIWTADVTTDADGGIKFTIGNWDTNWGTDTFPFGTGTQNGANIPIVAGSYKVFFNDITGSYIFMAQ